LDRSVSSENTNPSNIVENEIGEHVKRAGKVSVLEHQWRRPFGRPRRRWRRVLKSIYRKRCEMDLSGSGEGPAGRYFENGNDTRVT
jgi:hypothetical protein